MLGRLAEDPKTTDTGSGGTRSADQPPLPSPGRGEAAPRVGLFAVLAALAVIMAAIGFGNGPAGG